MRNTARLHLWALFICWLMSSPIWSAQVPATKPVDLTARLELLIAQLGDEDPQARRKASILLKNVPLAAYPAVQQVLDTRDDLEPEIRSRLTSIRQTLGALVARSNRLRAIRQWDIQSSLEAYEKFGERDQKWDASVRRAIALQADARWMRQLPPPETRTVLNSAKAAGCTDPLFLLLSATYARRTGDLDEHGAALLLSQAAKKIAKSDYPPERKCDVFAQYGGLVGRSPGAWPDIRSADGDFYRRGAIDLFARVKGVPPAFLYDLAMTVLSAFDENSPPIFDMQHLWEAFDKVAPGSPYPLVFRGWCDVVMSKQRYWKNGKWDEQTNIEYRRKAEELFEKAYQMDRADGLAAAAAMEMAMPSRDGSPSDMPQETMEKWFKRAMEANPDNRDACSRKLRYLFALEGGDKEAIEFARECLASENWRGQLPNILVEYHETMGNLAQDKVAYWASPGVWPDVKTVLEGYLALYPGDLKIQSHCAKVAAQCSQWAEANRWFERLGDLPEVGVFGSMASYNYLKRKAARLANQRATQPAGE